MPIISKIGAKSLKVRLVYGVIFTVLILGAITMLYPFLLMLSGATKSEADITRIDCYPRFWFDDLILFQKYVESKHYADLLRAEHSWSQQIIHWYDIERPTESEYLEDFLAWRQTDQSKWWSMGHSGGKLMLPVNAREFRKLMSERFNKDLSAYNKAAGTAVRFWNFVLPPSPNPLRYPRENVGLVAFFNEFAKTRPIKDRVIGNPDGLFWKKYLTPKYTYRIAEYNKQHGTNYSSYNEVFLTERVGENPKQREDWQDFVRNDLPLAYIRLPQGLTKNYQTFLRTKKYIDIAEYNHIHKGSDYKSFDSIPLPSSMPEDRMDQIDWQLFISDRELCPAEEIEVYGPRQSFERFVAKRRGKSVEEIAPIRLPIPQADWHDCMADKSALRKEFTTRNFKHVFDFLLIHGRGIPNTIIYCALAIGLALLVNPLAAYALSQYKPPSTYAILLFCMATMAFPAEVTMIPAFLLLKRFPLWSIIAGSIAFVLSLWILSKYCKKIPELLRVLLALLTAFVVGFWVVPLLTDKPHITLLNSFAALVLPTMANGYMIFLLKGFFDSIPRELYEAADLDGASQWTKFWSFTLGLSKPILAVMALGAFTMAYTNFMMALIIIPDQKMWTMMVWLFQLQSPKISHQSVRYASIAVAAIPTFVVFVFCQRVIIRGIVVPTEK